MTIFLKHTLTPCLHAVWKNVSINKAINSQEVPVKEKHARDILLQLEKGAQTFWAVVSRLPLTSNAVLNWKFCHVFHKLLRDGHPYVSSYDIDTDLLSRWRRMVERVQSVLQNPAFPCNLMLMFGSMDMSRPVSMTTPGQCRLAPLIPAVLDSSPLYDFIVKLLFKLHSCLPADTLQGHRDRFKEQFKRLREYFHRSSNLQYFKRLIQIPQLPEHPPNFLHASALSEHVSPIVVIPEESSSPEVEATLLTDDLIDTDTCLLEVKFQQSHHFICLHSLPAIHDPRPREKFARELGSLKEELDTCRLEVSQRSNYIQLSTKLGELEADLAEQVHLRRQAVEEAEFVRAEMEELQRQREDEERTHRSLTEIEKRAQANEQRYNKLKEKYTELVQNHADLLRKNAEVTKQLSTARQGHQEAEQARLELEKNRSKIENNKECCFLQECSPKGRDVQQDELGDLVEQEMSATTAAVEQAASRIQEMLNAARSDGDHLCHGYVSLQGMASPQEFYARNSHWTEGLISASKAVGLAATLLVDGADAVVMGHGRLEELVVCSHEVTASTAHLVAASKVIFFHGFVLLFPFLFFFFFYYPFLPLPCSLLPVTALSIIPFSPLRGFVVSATLDFSRLTLTQVKRKEMDTQVRVLELENSLQREREHLGELRKKHYELAGAAEGWDEDGMCGGAREWDGVYNGCQIIE
uniref:Huntingtin interacting protein 1 n=1 Tax=Eptatretus burgeri TaxID=7764 RepID=A0A8C4Q406_EPTBU